jgi:hypothetical protein
MTFDPIANTLTLPARPCPFFGAKMHGNAINIPPFLVGCSTCGAAIPAEHYQAVCIAMAGDTQQYIDLYRNAALRLNRIIHAAGPLLEALKHD